MGVSKFRGENIELERSNGWGPLVSLWWTLENFVYSFWNE